MSVLRYFIYTSGHSLFSREKRALLVAGPVAPFFVRRDEPAEAAARNPAAAGSAGTARFRRIANTTRCAPPSPLSSPPSSPTSHG